jgi:hypothetical protein
LTIRSSGLFSSELLWHHRSHIESVELLGRVISPIPIPLPVQDNKNREETQTNIHAFSGIRTHNPSVCAVEDISYLRLRDHPMGYVYSNSKNRGLSNGLQYIKWRLSRKKFLTVLEKFQ